MHAAWVRENTLEAYFVKLTGTGTIFRLSYNSTAGAGEWTSTPGALQNVTIEELRAEFGDSPNSTMTVSFGQRSQPSETSWSTVCVSALVDLAGAKEYDGNCPHGPSIFFDLHTGAERLKREIVCGGETDAARNWTRAVTRFLHESCPTCNNL